MKELLIILVGVMVALTLVSCGDTHVHDWGEWTVVEGEEPTCTAYGLEERVCKLDPTHVETRDIEPINHSYVWTGDTSVHWQRCKDCNDTTPEEGHDLQGELLQTETGHYQLCSICGRRGPVESHISSGPATLEEAEYCTECNYVMSPKLDMLDGKKFIFIGNSFTYYGRCVKSPSGTSQEMREGDTGYFYQLCKANGHDVSVTNWTFGKHTLKSLFDTCTINGCGVTDHKADLVNRYYDYVVIQEGSGQNILTTLEQMRYVMDFFREANPDVKFVFLVPHWVYFGTTYTSLKNALPEIENLGVTMVDWGRVTYDIYAGVAQIPGSTQTYDKRSFMVSKEGDEYHENLLSGYITALMTYSAITGDKAEGQTYSFCTSTQIDNFISSYYTTNTTNMKEIFASEVDMLGIQRIIDQYLVDKPYRSEHVCDFGEWTIVSGKEPTCKHVGVEERVCKLNPLHVETRDSALGDHSYGTTYLINDDVHYQLCTVCNEPSITEVHTSDAPATVNNPQICNKCGYEMEPKINLTGKKIIFIGNSMTYYGRCVKTPKGTTNVSQSDREGDNGYFYQLCKKNGFDVSVTNWTYGGHTLTNILSNKCTSNKSCKGYDHSQDLTDYYFDYVVFQEGRGAPFESTIATITAAMEMFREANPNVKFVYLVPHRAYESQTYINIRTGLKELEGLGLIIVDWGRMIYDVYSGNVAVPGAVKTYDQYTFRIDDSSWHPNVLTGYFTALMTYCTITGASAVGQSYSFCTTSQMDSNMAYYSDEAKELTNMKEIFASTADMRGLQELVDRYIAEKEYRTEILGEQISE